MICSGHSVKVQLHVHFINRVVNTIYYQINYDTGNNYFSFKSVELNHKS